MNFKKILFLVIFIGVTINSNAQKKMNFGLHAGLGMYKFHGNNNLQSPYGSKYGFMSAWLAGIDLQKNLNSKLDLFIQLTYENKGTLVLDPIYRDLSGQVIPSAKKNYKFTYIVLPFLFKYNFSSGKNKIYLAAGPYLGFLMKSQLSITDIEPYEDLVYKENLIYYNNVEIGFNLGIGCEFSLSSKQKLFTEVRGTSGLTNIDKIYYGSGKGKNGGVQFIVGTMF